MIATRGKGLWVEKLASSVYQVCTGVYDTSNRISRGAAIGSKLVTSS